MLFMCILVLVIIRLNKTGSLQGNDMRRLCSAVRSIYTVVAQQQKICKINLRATTVTVRGFSCL